MILLVAGGLNVGFVWVELLDYVAVQIVMSLIAATLIAPMMTLLNNVLRAPSMKRIRIGLTRWVWVSFLAIVGAVVFQIVFHEVWKRVQSIDLPFAWWFIWLTTTLATGLLLYTACEPLRMRRVRSTFSAINRWRLESLIY